MEDRFLLTAAGVNGFPPQDIGAFLAFCAGEWLTLRSRFDPVDGGLDDADDAWHRSERGELRVIHIESDRPDHPGELLITPPVGSPRRLIFETGGHFHADDRQGTWRLWPDGSLELSLRDGEVEVRERIWFTKPNLRLRSSVERRPDGSAGRASFSSEIRRPPRPAGGS
jgi:hypothetical protein